jgi:hypothetical protein
MDDDRDRCFRSGLKGYQLGSYPEMNDLISWNIVMRNEAGRYPLLPPSQVSHSVECNPHADTDSCA